MLYINKFQNNYNKIKIYFDKLNKNKDHFNNSNDICTPLDCVKEMIESIPNDFWKKENLKILDSCVGNGNFHAYIATKTNMKNLYFNEINEKRIENLKKYFGKNINLSIKDFLSFKNKEKYDLVVSNPPYAKFTTDGKRVSKNHNLSRDFIRKALKITKMGGYILFVVPNNWMSLADRNDLPKELSKYKFIRLNIHGAKKYFPKIGSSFTWFLLQKEKNDNKHKTLIENYYFLKQNFKAIIPNNINFIPLYYSNIVKSILEKTIYSNLEKYKIETTSFLHRHTKKQYISKVKSDFFKYKLIHTPSQTLWSGVKHKFHNGYKVFIPLTNQYEPFIDFDCGMTQSIAFIRCKNKTQAKIIKNELENDIYKFLIAITRYGNFNNVRILQKLPYLNKIIHKINKDEWKVVKNFNKKYYEKK